MRTSITQTKDKLEEVPGWVLEVNGLPRIVPASRYGGPMIYGGAPENPTWLSAITCSDGVAYVHTFGLAPAARGSVLLRVAIRETIREAKKLGAVALQCNVAPEHVDVLRGMPGGKVAENYLLTLDLREARDGID
jgi:hypothetical protein